MTETLQPLLDLQDVDLQHDRLLDRLAKLPEKGELTALEGRMAEVRAAIAAVEARAEDIIREMNRLEADVRAAEDKIAREEAKLYGGEVSNPKELSALQSEIEMLKRRKGPVEDAAIEQLMARDDAYEERARLQAELDDLGKEADALRAVIQSKAGDIDGEMATVTGQRETLRGQVPEDLLELYETLRESKRGVGAGKLQGGTCTACREALSAMEVDRIKQAARAGESRFRCEHCRRILVVA